MCFCGNKREYRIEGNFGEFGNSLQIRQSLTRQLLVAPEISISVETVSGHPVNRVTFSPGPTRFANYPGLTRIGSREKRNCSFDDVKTC